MNLHRIATVVLLGIGAARAQGQTPVYPGMSAPYPYGSPYAYSAAPRPQQRALYVAASPTDWSGGWSPGGMVAPLKPSSTTLQVSTAPVQRPGAPKVESTRPRHADDNDPIILYDGISRLGSKGRQSTNLLVSQGKGNAEALPAPEAPPSPAAAPVVPPPAAACDGCSGDACAGYPLCGEEKSCPDDDPFRIWLPKGSWNVQVLFGHYWDVDAANYNWLPMHVRLGGVWRCPHVVGAFEPMIDLTTAVTSDSDFGNWFIGPSLILRYNCARLGSRVVPYVQGGVGFQYNDGYKDPNPTNGSHLNLTAQTQAGMRIFLGPNLSVDFEMGFQHISNMNMSDRDEGMNALGATMGFSHFCGACRRQ